jgi:hypothetical protein
MIFSEPWILNFYHKVQVCEAPKIGAGSVRVSLRGSKLPGVKAQALQKGSFLLSRFLPAAK